MSRRAAFAPPARIVEFEDPRRQAALARRWSANVGAWTARAIQGDPWTVLHDHDRVNYFDPRTTDSPARPAREVIQWTAFPNRLEYLMEQTYPRRFNNDDLLRLADHGGLPEIPKKVCPRLDTTSPRIPYHPAGPRGWQDEYCEWAVTRDPESGKITRIAFTCENCDYWFTLWQESPEHVLETYRALVGPEVALEDLYLRAPGGEPVIDPQTGRPAYDPLNRWNRGPVADDTRGGAVHLTSSPNTLPDEIYVAASATVIREADRDPQALVCAGNYGGPFRHSDPHIVFVTNQIVRGLKQRVTLADPVGLYIQEPVWSGYALPALPGAEGRHPRDFWRVLRGSARGANPDLPDDMGYILHAVYEVPDGLGFTVGDITIYGRPIDYAAQIAQTFDIALAAEAIPAPGPMPDPVPAQTRRSDPLPAPQQLMPRAVLEAGGTGRGGATPSAPLAIRPGQRLRDIALTCKGAAEGAAVRAVSARDGSALEVAVTGVRRGQQLLLSGMEVTNTLDVLLLDIAAAATATPGDYALTLRAPDGREGPPITYVLYVEG